MNKIIITLTFLLGLVYTNAQVGIETTTVEGDGIMDFPQPATKGILLPRASNVTSLPNIAGTLAYDMNTDQVMYNHAGTWTSMSGVGTAVGHDIATYPEKGGLGVKVEDGTGGVAPDGVLTLESNSKALILPRVPDATLLPSPQAGMICYDMASNSIAVFNGVEWSFWN